jgi:hypothetical protein
MNPWQNVFRTLVPISALALSAVGPTQAATLNLHPVADTTLQEAFPNNNLGDGTSFQAGGRRQGGRARGLMRFDIAGSLPAGATITSVSLTLNVVGVPSGGVNSLFDLDRLLSGWGEGTGSDHGGTPGGAGQATWNNRLGAGSPWLSAGGDFSVTVSASRAIAGMGGYTFSSTANLVSDVQGWLNNPANNFGWLLRSESELTPTSIRRFGSRDDAVNSPLLTVVYVVPEPTVLSFLGVGLAAAGWRWRRARARTAATTLNPAIR